MTTTTAGSTDTSSYPATAVSLARMFYDRVPATPRAEAFRAQPRRRQSGRGASRGRAARPGGRAGAARDSCVRFGDGQVRGRAAQVAAARRA